MYDPVRDALMSNATTTTTAATAAAAAAEDEGRQRTDGEPMVLSENGERLVVEGRGYDGGFVIGARGPVLTTDEG